MNDYEKKDEKGREIFKQFCHEQQWCKHNKDAKDKMAHWDLSYFSGDTAMIGEIKYRNYSSTAFPDWFLQLDKLKYLQAMYKFIKLNGKETKITYINHYADGKTLIWDLTNLNILDYDIKKIMLQKNDFDEEIVLKEVIYLKATEAIYGSPTNDLESYLDSNINNEEDEDDGLPF